MSNLVVDSSVVAKWILPEADSAKAQQLFVQTAASGERLIVLDLVFPEVANAIWKRHRQQLIDLSEAKELIDALISSPVSVEPAVSLLVSAFENRRQVRPRHLRCLIRSAGGPTRTCLGLPPTNRSSTRSTQISPESCCFAISRSANVVPNRRGTQLVSELRAFA